MSSKRFLPRAPTSWEDAGKVSICLKRQHCCVDGRLLSSGVHSLTQRLFRVRWWVWTILWLGGVGTVPARIIATALMYCMLIPSILVSILGCLFVRGAISWLWPLKLFTWGWVIAGYWHKFNCCSRCHLWSVACVIGWPTQHEWFWLPDLGGWILTFPLKWNVEVACSSGQEEKIMSLF